MKKAKAIISAVIASAMLVSFTPSYAKETNYYGDFSMPQKDFSEFEYKSYDMSNFDAIIEKTEKLIQTKATEKNLTDFENILYELDEQFRKLDNCANFAYIELSKNNTEENNNEYANVVSMSYNAEKKYRELITTAAQTDYRSFLISYFGDEETLNEFIGNNHSEQYYILVDQERKLLSEYTQNQFGSYILKTDDGSELSFADINEKLYDVQNQQNASDEEIQAESEKVMNLLNRYYDESLQIIGNIYIKLIDVRNKIAMEEGYDNYIQYAYENIYARDYTIDDALKFVEGVREYIMPVCSDITLSALAAEPADYTNMTDDVIIDTLKPYFDDMSSELYASYNYLIDYNMYDWDDSPTKIQQGSAYTAYLNEYRTPYIFASPAKDDQQWKFRMMIHEFGHFNTLLHDNAYNPEIGTGEARLNADVAEINSQGLELLMTHYYRDIFGKYANAESASEISEMLRVIRDSCILTEFENAAFSLQNPTVDELSKTYADIAQKYGINTDNSESKNSWIEIPHLFNLPLYYISYGISAMSALDIWQQSQTNFDSACDRYFKLSALGDFVELKSSLNECGFEDIFSTEYSKKLADTLNAAFGLDYSDVEKDEWYFPSVLATLKYIDGNSETEYGVGKCASRAVTAIGIAKLCNNDFDGITTAFADVPAENIKYIGWAEENGIVDGYDDATFGGDDDVTREQAITMFYRCAKALNLDTASEDTMTYSDSASVSEWAEDAVKWANANGLINGYDDGTLKPLNNVSKEEFAKLLYQFMDIVY